MKITVSVPDEADVSAVDNIKANEMEKFNAVCFWLIKQCSDTNAKTMTVRLDNVHRLGKALGSWKVTINQVESLTPRR